MTEQTSRLQIVIDSGDAEKRIKALKRQLRELGGAADDTTDDTNRLDRANNNLNNSTSRLSKTIALAGKAIKYGGVALFGLSAAAVKVSGDFEEAMNGVRAVSGAVGQDFDQMRALAKKMGSETAYSATEAANGMEFLAMAGLNTQQIMATIPNALNLAAAGNIDLATSADILSNIMTGMGIAAEDSGRAADVLAATAAGANVDVRMLGESMKYAAPIAKQLGLSLEDTAASMGVLGNAGIQGSEAGTALRAIYVRLATHKKSREWFDTLGISVTDATGKVKSMVAILKEMQEASKDMSAQDRLAMYKDTVGQEAMSALGVSIDSITDGSLDRLIEKLENAKGSAKAMADIRMEGFNGAIKGAKSAAEGFLIAMGDSGLLDLAAGSVTALANGIRSMTTALPAATADITAFFQSAEVATAVEMAINGLKGAWTNLVSVIKRTGEIIAPVISFFREHDKLSEALAISIGLVASALAIYNTAVIIGTAVTGGFVAVMALLTSPITLAVAALVALTTAGVYLYQNWDKVEQVISDNRIAFGLLAFAVTGLGSVLLAAKFPMAVTAIQMGVMATASAAWSVAAGVAAAATWTFNTALAVLTSPILAVVAAIALIAAGGYLVVKNWGAISAGLKAEFERIKGAVMSAVNGMQAAWDRGVANTRNAFINIGNTISTTLRELPSRMLQIGKDIVQGLINGIKSGVSGVTTAIGDMASSAIAKAKAVLDIHSPSRVMKKVGEHTAEGMAVGIKKKAKVVKTEAQKMAESAVKAVQDGIARLKKELALFGNDSRLAAFNYDVSVGTFNGVSSKEINQTRGLLTQIEAAKADADAKDKLAAANKSVQDSIDGLIKQQALFGNNSSLASLMYDIEYTDKYKDATKELTDQLIEQTRALEQLGMTAKATAAIQERFAQLAKDRETTSANLQGTLSGIEAETPLGKIQAEYDARMAVVEKYEQLHTDMIGVQTEARLAIEQSYMDAKQQLMLSQSEAIFSGLSGMAKGFLGEQSGIYRTLYTMQKGYTLSSALLSSKKAIMDAWANTPGTYFSKAAAVGKVVLSTSAITSAISGLAPQGFKKGGYTGNMGINQVAGQVHGQEYVFDAKATKRIGVDNLNAMRSGKAPKGSETKVIINNYSNEKANVQTTPDGDTIVTIGKMLDQKIDGKLSKFERDLYRQGRPLHGMR